MQKTTVLIVEDEFMIADFLEDILVEAGFSVCGIAGTTADAIALGERYNPDMGIIDLRLADGGLGTDVAAALRLHGRFGVLYASGDPDNALLKNAQGEASIAKPYSAETMIAALGIIREQISGLPLSTFPQGFKLLERANA